MNAVVQATPKDVSAAESWAQRICSAWSLSAKAIIETGRQLIEAKAATDHGEWTAITKLLPFNESTIQRLIAIGSDPRLVNPAILPFLPSHWTKIHKLHKITDEAKFLKRLRELTPIDGSRAIMGSRHEPDDSLDYFPTPPWATRALIECVLFELGILKVKHAWEPACGEGHIAEVLTEYCDEVWASDIFDYGYGETSDFLTTTDKYAEWIITNPPFGDSAIKFVLHALDHADNVAMFFRSQWAVEGIERYTAIFKDRPPTLCAFFVERVPLCKGRWEPEGTTATAYCWLVWATQKRPRPPFWIPPGQRESLTHKDDAERFTAHPVLKRKHENATTVPSSMVASGPASSLSANRDGAGLLSR